MHFEWLALAAALSEKQHIPLRLQPGGESCSDLGIKRVSEITHNQTDNTALAAAQCRSLTVTYKLQFFDCRMDAGNFMLKACFLKKV